MALTPSFTSSQPVGKPSVVRLTDNSTGSDAAVTQRRVYLRKDDGKFIVPTSTSTDYIQWSYSNATIDIDALDKDYALLITVEWLNVSNVILYTKTNNPEIFSSYNEDFDYSTTQQLTGNPILINDSRFFTEKSNLRTFLDSAERAILRATDQYGAQKCLDAATNLRVKSRYYFNINA